MCAVCANTTQSDLEKELVALRRVGEVEKDKVDQLELDLTHWQARAEGEKHKMGEVQIVVFLPIKYG